MTDIDLNKLLLVAKDAAYKAGTHLRKFYSQNAGILSTFGKDIKTEADESAEKIIIDSLESTNLTILSEESGLKINSTDLDIKNGLQNNLTWIIDPLDGTFNFSRSLPFCCVSISLTCGNEPLLGVIYDFPNNILYAGCLELGAYCNDIPISVSGVNNFNQAVLATGFPSNRNFSEEALSKTIKRVQLFKKIRMIGSAALSLVNVANGKFDAYYEEDIWWWDVAAGLAILKAAGGDYKISKLNENYQLEVSANNGKFKHI